MKMASFSKMNNISHIDKQKSSEIWAFDPVHTLLGDVISNINYFGESPDIRFDYFGNRVGIEIIDCHPKEFDIITNRAINNLYLKLAENLKSKQIFGIYFIEFRQDVLNNSIINDIKNDLFDEVSEAIHGSIKPEEYKFIYGFRKSEVPVSDNTFIHPVSHMMNLVKTPQTSDIINCVKKKNNIFDKYDKTLDEIWLLIHIPTDVNCCSTKGIGKIDVATKFRRIYIPDDMFHARLIYQKDATE